MYGSHLPALLGSWVCSSFLPASCDSLLAIAVSKAKASSSATAITLPAILRKI